MEYLQTPAQFLHTIHAGNIPVHFVHFHGAGRPARTFQRATAQLSTPK